MSPYSPSPAMAGALTWVWKVLARLDSALANQKRFVADASHELRTPLAVMCTVVDVTLAKPLPTRSQLMKMAVEVRDSVDRSEALIAALLTLARSDAGVGVRQLVDLELVAENAVDALPFITRAGSTLETEFAHAPVIGDPLLIERLVGNLLENATRHNVHGGWIRATTHRAGEGVFLAISNSGKLISPNEIPGLFVPFRRTATHTGKAQGLGLGLTIARSIAALHQGQLEAVSRPDGGMDACLRLPLSPDKDPPSVV